MTNLREKIDLPISSLSDTLSETGSPKDVIDDVFSSNLTQLFLLLDFMSLRRVKNLRVMITLMLIKDMSDMRKFLSMMIL